MLSALTEAAGLLHQGICRFCVIVGAESYLDRETLGWLDETYRLKSERNVDGFVPGECAVLLLVELEQHARRRGATSRARLTGLGRAMEKQTLWSNRYSTSEGLGQAFGQALGQSSTEAIHWTICDLNGESYRSQEWGTTRFRLAERFDPGLKLWHPSDCIGDIGAASGGLHIVMACRAFERHYAPDDRALIWCSSDGGTRAACVVMKPN
ncbi:hypothetical protein [Archangium sp.]|uniref:hypothetical protein n=1 Tax=Archangium sp. TaxID=1872627 RepID=UPI002D51A4D0|nr:hypothetical protein [Archangium sp.]HYO55768.1 hypothetical protein [Archangium sp.]